MIIVKFPKEFFAIVLCINMAAVTSRENPELETFVSFCVTRSIPNFRVLLLCVYAPFYFSSLLSHFGRSHFFVFFFGSFLSI